MAGSKGGVGARGKGMDRGVEEGGGKGRLGEDGILCCGQGERGCG